MKIKQLASLLSGVLLFGMVSCEYQTIVPNEVIIPPTPVDFTTQIEPFLTQLCATCHTGSMKPNFEKGKAYASIMSLNLVDTANPAGSKLMVQINSGHNTAKDMTTEQKALLLKWISEGAQGTIPPVSYKNEVEPIFISVNCTMCHSGSQVPDFRVGKSYASLTGNNVVVAGNPSGSKLVQYINAGHNTASSMTAAQKGTVSKWITEGALNN